MFRFVSRQNENQSIVSRVYHVADDTTLSTKQLLTVISQVINKPAKILNTPKFLVHLIAKIGDVLPLPMNGERVQKLTENYCVSNAKIKKAIGKELPLTAEEGIERTIQSFLS